MEDSPAPHQGPKTRARIPTTVRRIAGYSWWFEPNRKLDGIKRDFRSALLTEVTLDPAAPVMKDVFCGTGRVSEATATGTLTKVDTGNEIKMPRKAKATCEVGYDTVAKAFHVKGDRTRTFTACDYLILKDDGTSTAGWKTETIPTP